jgi:hypothetical protein
MKPINPVTDRTIADINNRTAKAFFNIADFLRIYGNEQWVRDIQAVLQGEAAALNSLDTPTITSMASADAINALIENIELLRAAAPVVVDGLEIVLKYNWLKGLNAAAPDFEDANAWERKLDILRAAIVRAGEYRMFCGVPAAGQPRYWQYRWRTLTYAPDLSNPVRHARAGASISGTGITRQNSFRRC